MSLKHMDGFDSILDQSDLNAVGWRSLNTLSTVCGAFAGAPSINGKEGKALAVVGPVPNSNTGYYPLQTTAVPDYGVLQLPGTVKDYWDAGGFAIGMRVKLNSGINQYPIPNVNIQQFAVDGSTLYAVMVSGATYSIQYSTDGKTWQPLPNIPFTVDANTSITTANGYLVASQHNVTTCRLYSTNNLGATWQQTQPLAGVTGLYGAVYTGDATWPYVTMARSGTAGVAGTYLLSDLSSSANIVRGSPANMVATNIYGVRLKYLANANYVVAIYSNGLMLFGKVDAGLANAEAWTSLSYNGQGFTGATYDVEFASNRWYIASANDGVKWATNPGALPDIQPPPAGAMTQATGTSSAYGLCRVGNTLLAVGNQAKVAYSKDGGVTWTPAQGKYLIKTNATNWVAARASADTFYAVTSSNSGVIAKTTTASEGWDLVYAADPVEGGPQYTSTLGVYATPGFTSTGTMSAPSGSASVMISTLASDGTRQLSLRNRNTAISNNVTITNSSNGGIRYLELIATKDPATTNSFTLALRLDGSPLLASTGSIALADAADTTSVLVFNIPRSGQVSRIDDMYLTDFSGTRNNTFLGPSTIIPRLPATDVQAQWTKEGTAASNALSVRKVARSADSGGNSVTATGDGFKDVYASDSTPVASDFVGYRVAGIKLDVYARRRTGAVPGIKVGVVSGSASAESPEFQIGSLTPEYHSAIIEDDPNTSAAWTVASALDADLSINKTS